jgi:HEAT repeat protein
LKTSHPDETIVELPVAGAVTATRPFETATTPEAEARLRAVAADALARGDSVPANDFFSRVLGGVMDERGARLLVRVGADLKEEMPVRLRALEFLALMKDRSVCKELKTLATEDDFEFVRRFALVALAESVGADAMPELLMAMEDDGAWVREDAATLLGRYGDERAVKPLQRATRDTNEDARKAAQVALQVLLGRLKR